MKILSIGNSFSQDAHRWLHSLAAAGNDNIDTYNLYIGGCTLERHWECIQNNLNDYDKEGNDGKFLCKSSVSEALSGDTFDVITLQQASGFSGKPQSYIPYLSDISEFVKRYQPKAKIYFHKTWSYEIDSTHEHFKFYNNDQKEMYRRISDSSEMASKLIGAEIIPVGDVIQSLRESTKEFDYAGGGLSLCRDGFHLSLLYGRFAAAATWYKVLTGKDADTDKFAEQNPDFDISLLKVIETAILKF